MAEKADMKRAHPLTKEPPTQPRLFTEITEPTLRHFGETPLPQKHKNTEQSATNSTWTATAYTAYLFVEDAN